MARDGANDTDLLLGVRMFFCTIKRVTYPKCLRIKLPL
jgi:hypothetical protein